MDFEDGQNPKQIWKKMLENILGFGLVIAASAALSAILILTGHKTVVRIGLVDNPDAKRKLHKEPIPLFGGIAIFLTICAVVIVTVQFFGYQFSPETHFDLKHAGLLLASFILLSIGVLDDRFKIRGRHKLMGQVLVASILIGSDYVFREVSVFGEVIRFGIFSSIIVAFWILGSINSVNLLDGADGFAGTLGFVVSLALSLMAIFAAQERPELYVDAIIAASLCGAIGGFLCFNLPPAKIYLGDAGSMLIGLILGALAISTSLKAGTLYSFVAPIAILTIPIMDSAVAIIRRKMTGRGIYAVDRGHLHHNLLGQGLSPRMAVLWMLVLSSTTALGGTISFITRESEFAVIASGLVILFLVAGRVFGFAEFRMIGQKVKGVMAGMSGKDKNTAQEGQQYQLQGTRNWGALFENVRRFSESKGFDKITVDINAPWIHESYHATWKRKGQLVEGENEWNAQFPLVHKGAIYGRVEVEASSDSSCAYTNLPTMMELVEHELENMVAPKNPIPPQIEDQEEPPKKNSNSDSAVAVF